MELDKRFFILLSGGIPEYSRPLHGFLVGQTFSNFDLRNALCRKKQVSRQSARGLQLLLFFFLSNNGGLLLEATP